MDCPCDKCQTRKTFARMFDFHFYGSDCPYECEKYDLYCSSKEHEKQLEEAETKEKGAAV